MPKAVLCKRAHFYTQLTGEKMPKPTNTTVHKEARHWFLYALELEKQLVSNALDIDNTNEMLTSQERLLDLNICMLRESEEARHAQAVLIEKARDYVSDLHQNPFDNDIIKELSAAIEAYNEQCAKVATCST